MPATVPRDLAREAAQVDEPGALDMARKVAAMDPPTRAAAAVKLAVEGVSYTDIARTLDYESPGAAKQAVWGSIGDIEIDADEVKRKRDLMGKGLGRLLTSCMRRATNPHDPDHLGYLRVTLAIFDRQARLYGLDAPTNLVVHTPTQREIDQYVATVRQLHLVAAGDVEADILDAEIIEDGDEHAGSQAS